MRRDASVVTEFLLWIGLYNLAAPLIFIPMIASEPFADLVLRRATEIVAQPYEHGPFGRMWLWWVTATNAALGATMVLATRWPRPAQAEVTLVVLGVYAVMWLAMLVGARGPRWGRGIYITHALWLAQMGWAGWALWAMP